MGLSASARLVADRGEAAISDDFFRSRGFLEAEGTTHTLVVESPGRIASVPLIVREIEGADRVDAISPYAYPGALIEGEGEAPAADEVDWARQASSPPSAASG